MAENVADRWARMDEALSELRREVVELRAENRALQQRIDLSAASSDGGASGRGQADGAGVTAPEPRLDRRRLLLGGVTAGAAAVASVVATSQPAAAANGQALLLGQTNTATAETKLSYGANVNNGFRVEGGSDLAMIEGYQTGTGAGFKGMNAGSGSGVEARANNGPAVDAKSTNGVALHAYVESNFEVADNGNPAILAEGWKGPGLLARSTFGGSGVKAEAEGDGHGVEVSTIYGDGVRASSFDGAGVFTRSAAGIGGNVFGGLAQLRLRVEPDDLYGGVRQAPTGDSAAHELGDVVRDSAGDLWLCTLAGTPGRWRKLAGPATAGALHVLPTPVRIYDSRPGSTPSQGPKTKLTGNVARALDCKVNNSGVPAGAAAVALTVLLVNASNANGNLTVWANGAARPASNTIVWGPGSGRYTTSTLCALDTAAKLQVSASAATDLVLDIVGYYR